MEQPTNREIAAQATYAWLGWKSGQNWRNAGATKGEAVWAGISGYAYWRVFIRGLLVAPLGLLALTGFVNGAFWPEAAEPPMDPVSFFLLVVTPWGLALQGVLYCKSIDDSLMRQGLVYRAFAPLERVFANVRPFWVYALMPFPLWVVATLAGYGVIA